MITFNPSPNFTRIDTQVVSSEHFKRNVPEDWIENIKEDLTYDYGSYSCQIIPKDEIIVSKNDFEIDQMIGGHYRIIGTILNQYQEIWGGDSACKDHYDEELVKEVYDKWDGKLFLSYDYYGRMNYVIES